MAEYAIVDKQSFVVSGIGLELKSSYMDQAGLKEEKEVFYKGMMSDGTLQKLKSLAANGRFFLVNEAVDDKLMHYLGVETTGTLPEMTWQITFPEGKYLVIPGEGDSEYGLAEKLTEIAFGEVLKSEKGYAYTGGPNAAVIRKEENGRYTGEMWIPVEKQ